MWLAGSSKIHKKGGLRMSESIRISLKAARVNAGLTMEEACKALKVSKSTIMNWEKGYTIPDADKAIALSELYKIPLENIIFYKNS
jgi:transcriptional regulator with XRE-family HTH domain